jgi:alkylated DNA repair dioxygenase AlkB
MVHDNHQNLLPFQGETYLYPEFFSGQKADAFFSALKTGLKWKQEPIKLFGRLIMQPRLTALYGDESQPYGYSGITMNPMPWSEELRIIKMSLENVLSTEFTHVLCNFYRDGKDSMGWHRDNEEVLGKNPTIASVSFGATRKFQIRHFSSKNHKLDIPLSHGSLLVMAGESQHFWEHQIPKTKVEIGPRINLTFRKLY